MGDHVYIFVGDENGLVIGVNNEMDPKEKVMLVDLETFENLIGYTYDRDLNTNTWYVTGRVKKENTHYQDNVSLRRKTYN